MSERTKPWSEPVAIIGIAGRFPGADDVEAFWRNIAGGVESVSFFSDEELLAAGVEPAELNDSSYVKAGSCLRDIDLFDAAFFRMTAREAELTDPQQRILLECAWEAFENAGYDVERFEGAVGVYAGAGPNMYLWHHLANNPELGKALQNFPAIIGSEKDYLATRIAYALNLRGPSFTVQTACSTSLVAIHLACQGLLQNECEMAIAGGVSIRVPQIRGYRHQSGGVRSADGHTRTFDVAANGTVFGSGAAVVVLKRLSAAIDEGDCIRAVIKGTAINNDGAGKVGFTAPSVDGQAKVISAALRAAGVAAETIGYVEAHGTGTAIGDPVEIAALTRVFRESTDRKKFCAIGSAKTNVGHLEAASGIAGLIKATLALEHRTIPPSLHFENPNPKLNLDSSPFYVNTKLSSWPDDSGPRRASVTSLGFGGANAHAILEEAPTTCSGPATDSWKALVFSARTPTALERMTANLAEHLRQHPDLNLDDVAWTLQLGRKHFTCRRVVLCRTVADALMAIESLNPEYVFTSGQHVEVLAGSSELCGKGLVTTLAKVWLTGVVVQWQTLHPRKRRRVPLPSYPFERQRYWLDSRTLLATRKRARMAESSTKIAIVDWGAAPTANFAPSPSSLTTPVNSLQSHIAEICGNLLGVDHVDPNTSFFRMGGNSLIAVQMMSRIRDAFGINAPLAEFLAAPTVAQLACVVAGQLAGRGGGEKVERILNEIESKPTKEVVIAERFVESEKRCKNHAPLQFSLFFFSGDESAIEGDKYRLVREAAKFADRHGFTAIWTPERHFHRFGGLYPNPAVLGAALAASTDRIQIRAGSVVAPLHQPVRIAEEWSVVDNLSGGRVGLAFAAGFHPNDFILAPGAFAERKHIMLQHLETVQKLWRGDEIVAQGGGSGVSVKLFPRPVQAELPVWLSTAANPDVYVEAGKRGVNVLTALLLLSVDDLAQRIQLYRDSLKKHGHDPNSGTVTVMLHTFMGEDDAQVKETVRRPFCDYLRSHFEFIKPMAAQQNIKLDREHLSERELEALLSFAFERYYSQSALFGSGPTCLRTVQRLQAIGVNEIACLTDFGLEFDVVLQSLHHVAALRERVAAKVAMGEVA